MTRSMRTRLFLLLLVTTGVVWFSAVIWIFLSTRAEVESVLDSRLVEAANMVSSLVDKQDVDAAGAVGTASHENGARASYERQLSCQIWSFEGNLLSRSEGAPQGALTQAKAGFSQTEIDGERWRVYAVENKALGIRVLVGDNLHTRDGLVNDVIKGLLLPALLMAPVLAGLIWLSVGAGFAPLRRMAERLSARTASDLDAMPTDDATAETAPLIRALNALLERVAAARERERNFTAFAAHELRTPLAGIKTQAQIAIESGDPRIREKALHQIVHGVTRTGRLVRQLLDMASVEATGEKEPTGRCVPGRLLALLRDELTPHGGAAPVIVISEDLFRMEIDMNAELFTLAARNLIENAILHAGNTMILCKCLTDGDSVEIAIDDDGPGIPAEDLVRVTERFFRSGNKAMIGSGLGLSIAEFAVARGRAKLLLRNRKPIGLSARMIFDRRYVSFENSLTKTA